MEIIHIIKIDNKFFKAGLYKAQAFISTSLAPERGRNVKDLNAIIKERVPAKINNFTIFDSVKNIPIITIPKTIKLFTIKFIAANFTLLVTVKISHTESSGNAKI